MRDLQCEPEHFTSRIIFMSVYNDIVWWAKGTKKDVNTIHKTVANYARRFPRGDWSFWAWIRREITELTLTNPTDHGIKLQRTWWQIFQGPVIQNSSLQCLWERRTTKQKEGKRSQCTSMVVKKTSSCFSAQWFLRTQLCVLGAIADLCNELPKDLRAPGQPAAPWSFGKDGISTDLSISENSTICTAAEKPGARIPTKIEQLSEDQRISKLYSDAGLKLVETGQYFFSLDTEEGQEMQHFMPRVHDASKREEDSCERMERKQCCGSKKWSWLIQWMIQNLRYL